MKDEIKKLLEQATGASDVLVEASKEKTHGDYATSVALALATLRRGSGQENPRKIAEEIVAKIGKPKFIEKIEVAGPGFINFYLSADYFIGELKKVDENFGKVKKPFFGAKKVMVEYTDPNPFKEFHIGHLMSNTIGESIARLFDAQGVDVKRANYQGDVGMHVAKAIWGVRDMRKNRERNFKFDSIKDFAAGYAYGSQMYENEKERQEIIEVNKKIYDKSDDGINKLYGEGKKVSLKYFEEIYRKLDTKFDYYFFESQVADFGKKIVEDGLKKGVFEKGEKGAIVFKGEKFGLHTRVFINSEGLPTYEAKELGLAKIKYDKYKYDQSVIVTGNEINEYFKVLMSAMGQIFPELQKKTKHIGHGMLRLPDGKMSSRTGKVVTAELLIEKVKEMVRQKAVDKNLDDATVEIIAIGAIKYAILKQSIGSDIIFDFDKSISFEGDSGPYLQYAYVRAISVLAKAKAEKVKALLKKVPAEITQLEKMMTRFPEIVEKAGKEYEPHVITLYLTELAREFNNYYAHNKIVDSADEFSPYKVAVTQAFSVIMKNGLWLLGIKAPDKM